MYTLYFIYKFKKNNFEVYLWHIHTRKYSGVWQKWCDTYLITCKIRFSVALSTSTCKSRTNHMKINKSVPQYNEDISKASTRNWVLIGFVNNTIIYNKRWVPWYVRVCMGLNRDRCPTIKNEFKYFSVQKPKHFVCWKNK